MKTKRWLAIAVAAVFSVSQGAWALPKRESAIYYLLLVKYLEKASARDAYEHALVGLACLALGDFNRSGREIRAGLQDLEAREETRTAPTLWLALAILQHARLSGDAAYRQIALEMCGQFLRLPRFGGLPAIGPENGGDLPWGEIVSLEDARLAAAVMRLAGGPFAQEARRLEKSLKPWQHLPKNSFLMMALPADGAVEEATGRLREHFLAKNLYLVTDADLSGAIPAGSAASLLVACRAKLSDGRYEPLRRLIYSQNRFLDWLDEAEARAYRVSGAALMESRAEWFSPEGRAADRPEYGAASVCWDFFKRGWDPYSPGARSVASAGEEPDLNSPEALFEAARLHLVAGEKEKAEAIAQECADRYGADPGCADLVASSWLMLGKMYHDQSRAASGRLMFTSAEKFEQKRDRAFSRVRRGYAAASIAGGREAAVSASDVIRKIYH